ncbi:MAG: D-alanyl-D-alanine carboxypeptidase family protein [Fimbriimonadales bacterium]
MKAFVFAVGLFAATSACTQPVVGAKSAIVMDAATGAILFEKNARATRYPASTTKVMTALLLIEHVKPGAMITAPLDVKEVTGSSLHLRPGEQLTREDALYALMLRSANDVAHTVAVHIGGSDIKFAALMNKRATELGCVNTRFRNPHGLNDDGHSTCAFDLVTIAREAMKNDVFRRTVRAPSWVVLRSINQEDTLVQNTNKLLDFDPFIEGIKTGFTKPAGRCFVGAKSVDSWRLLSVVLNSPNWPKDTKSMFDWAFTELQRSEPMHKGQWVGNAPVRSGVSATMPSVLAQDFFVIFRRDHTGGRPTIEWVEARAPLQRGQVLGYVNATSFDGQRVRAAIVSTDDMPGAPPWQALAAIGAVCGSVVFGLRRRRRPRPRHRRQNAR